MPEWVVERGCAGKSRKQKQMFWFSLIWGDVVCNIGKILLYVYYMEQWNSAILHLLYSSSLFLLLLPTMVTLAQVVEQVIQWPNGWGFKSHSTSVVTSLFADVVVVGTSGRLRLMANQVAGFGGLEMWHQHIQKKVLFTDPSSVIKKISTQAAFSTKHSVKTLVLCQHKVELDKYLRAFSGSCLHGKGAEVPESATRVPVFTFSLHVHCGDFQPKACGKRNDDKTNKQSKTLKLLQVKLLLSINTSF